MADDIDREVAAAGLGVDPETLAERVARRRSSDVLERATLTMPKVGYMQRGGRDGQAHRAPRPHARGDADRRALASGGDVVKRALPSREELFAILDTVMDPEVPVLSVVELGIVRDVDRDRRAASS